MKPKYKRILLKVSGEALAGDNKFGLNPPVIDRISKGIKDCHDLGVEIAIVVGGGNFWRGRTSEGMDRTTADYIGMLATVMNSLALQDSLEQFGVQVRVQSALDMPRVTESFFKRNAVKHLEEGKIVIFAAGTGNPFFSTDTAASLRAAEIEADAILSAKSIDGVYDKDPAIHEDAKRYDELKYIDIIDQGLKVIDSTAATLCMDNDIPMLVFALDPPENIKKVLCGENIGTIIK